MCGCTGECDVLLCVILLSNVYNMRYYTRRARHLSSSHYVSGVSRQRRTQRYCPRRTFTCTFFFKQCKSAYDFWRKCRV